MITSLWLLVEHRPVVQPPVLRIDVQRPLPGHADPFGWDDDECKDETLQPAFHVKAWEHAADFGQEILVEVLQHGGEEQEHGIVLHRGKRKMPPAEVVILHVEVLLASAPLVVLADDLLLSACVVVGQYGTVHVFHAGQQLLSGQSLNLRALHYQAQMPVSEEVGELKRGDVHVLVIHLCGTPFLALVRTSPCARHNCWHGGRTPLCGGAGCSTSSLMKEPQSARNIRMYMP